MPEVLGTGGPGVVAGNPGGISEMSVSAVEWAANPDGREVDKCQT